MVLPAERLAQCVHRFRVERGRCVEPSLERGVGCTFVFSFVWSLAVKQYSRQTFAQGVGSLREGKSSPCFRRSAQASAHLVVAACWELQRGCREPTPRPRRHGTRLQSHCRPCFPPCGCPRCCCCQSCGGSCSSRQAKQRPGKKLWCRHGCAV